MALAAELINQPGVIAAGEYSYRGDRFSYKGEMNDDMAKMAAIMCRATTMSEHMQVNMLESFCPNCIDDMRRLVMQPGEEILHIIPQEFTVDKEQGIKEPVGMSGVRLEANCHVITGQVAAIRNILRCIQRAQLEIDQLILEPLASSAAVLSEEELEDFYH